MTYGNSDDEDLAGSGEIEGSAGEGRAEIDHRPSIHGNSDGKIRKSLIFLWNCNFIN